MTFFASLPASFENASWSLPYLQTLFAWMRRRGRKIGILDGRTGAVTFIQRFGGALNLNPHLHSLVPDGLFVSGPEPEEPFFFAPMPRPRESLL